MRILVALFATLAAGIASADSKPFVAWLIEPQQSDGASVEVWDAPEGGRVWRIVGPGGIVLAQMKQPVVRPGYVFNWGGCKIGADLKHDVIAVVRHKETLEWSTDIAAVWLADAKGRRFIRLDPRGVECQNEGYGV